jgi:hypothetical protein
MALNQQRDSEREALRVERCADGWNVVGPGGLASPNPVIKVIDHS